MPSQSAPRVLIVQQTLTHYRIPFFCRLAQRLQERGGELTVVCGRSDSTAAGAQLPWLRCGSLHEASVLGRRVTWLSKVDANAVQDADVLVLPGSSMLLSNYPLILRARGVGATVVFWGHGANFRQGRSGRCMVWLRGRFAAMGDWWLAYTEASAAVIARQRFPSDRVTTVDNTIDVESLMTARERVTPADRLALRESLCLRGRNTCLFVGSLNPTKRVDYLLAACDHIKASTPDFEMLVIGDGPDAATVRRFAGNRSWLRWVGSVTDVDARARLFSVSKLLLVPRGAGLCINDSFALGVPLVTTDFVGHGPEIAYLQNGVNGLMLKGEPSAKRYAADVSALLADPARLAVLRSNCEASARKLTLRNMVDRFVDGILSAWALARGPGTL